MSLDRILGHLAALVACDTRNPPRAISGESDIFRYCHEQVGDGFKTRIWDHGDGHVSWYAVRGTPDVLFNVHLDTVPDGDGWTGDPRTLVVKDGRAYGRGACDIKGAAAILLSLAQETDRPLALLFTSDEPTGCRAVLEHRGYLSVKVRFKGVPGHSSEARALRENAIHQMSHWADAALKVAAGYKHDEQDAGACMNIGIVEGGTKSNVIAGHAFVHWSCRLRPGDSNEEFLQAIQACVPAGSEVSWEVPFRGEPLPAAGQEDDASLGFCRTHAIPVGDPVDFWTEASIFSTAGMPAIVLGPGLIAQAHATDEWVGLEQLEKAHELYARVVNSDG
jgi:acetylornithine deacetylase